MMCIPKVTPSSWLVWPRENSLSLSLSAAPATGAAGGGIAEMPLLDTLIGPNPARKKKLWKKEEVWDE